MKVQLFLTCLAEQFYPDVLKGMVILLEDLGIEVHVPVEQTCCGQPLFNSGFTSQVRPMAIKWLDAFSKSDAVIVSPSGSCVEMVHHHFTELFQEGSSEHRLAQELAGRTFEFTDFLVNHLQVTDVGARYSGRVTYHASCHLLRGLGLREEAKQLLAAVRDLELVPLAEEDTCCGFGGVFSVIYPEVSRAMMEAKVGHIQASGADAVVACDAGCLMNIAGGLRKANSPVKALHVVEVLASNRGGHE